MKWADGKGEWVSLDGIAIPAMTLAESQAVQAVIDAKIASDEVTRLAKVARIRTQQVDGLFCKSCHFVLVVVFD